MTKHHPPASAARWLLCRPDGTIEDTHSYHPQWWPTADTTWRSLMPNDRQRHALIKRGWTIRRDGDQHTGCSDLTDQAVRAGRNAS